MMDTAALPYECVCVCVCVCVWQGGAAITGSGGEAALMVEAYKRDGPGWWW